MKLVFVSTLCGLLTLLLPPAWAGRVDQDRALAERGRGQILPLERLLHDVGRQLPGRMLKVELEEDDGRWVYEIRWQLPDGRVLELELDARDASWLQLKGPRLETLFPPRRGPEGTR